MKQKPSERIQDICDELEKKNPFAYNKDNDQTITLTHIVAIMQYLDETAICQSQEHNQRQTQ